MSTTVYPQVLKERYELDDVLGEGGMGTVYRCVERPTSTLFAVKFLTVDQILSDSGMRRFENECGLLARLDHPNIIGIRDHGVEEGMPYLVMELCVNLRGAPYTLRSLQQSFPNRRLPAQQLMTILPGLLDAVAHLHQQGLVHRDLKPDNVLLLEEEEGLYVPKLTDFGLIALTIDAGLRERYELDVEVSIQDNSLKSKAWVGTYTFMSPEQKRGELLDARSDVYALGLIIYRLATGYERLNPELPSDVNPDFPEWLDDMIEKALEDDAADRWDDAQAMFDALPETMKRQHRSWLKQQHTISLADAEAAEVGDESGVQDIGDGTETSVLAKDSRDSSEIFDSILDQTDASSWAANALALAAGDAGEGTEEFPDDAAEVPEQAADHDDDDDDEDFDPSMLSDWADEAEISDEEAEELAELAELAQLAKLGPTGAAAVGAGAVGAPSPDHATGTQRMVRVDVGAIPALVDTMNSDDPAAAAIARRTLGKFGGSDIPEIIRRHGRQGVPDEHRQAALVAVGMIGELGVPVLLKCLKGSDPEAREFAVNALPELGEAVVPSVVQLLIHKHAEVRLGAVRVLGQIPDMSASTALLPALRDQDASVRAAAMEALSRQDDVLSAPAAPAETSAAEDAAAEDAVPETPTTTEQRFPPAENAPAAKSMGPPTATNLRRDPAAKEAAERLEALKNTPLPTDFQIGDSDDEIEAALHHDDWQVRAAAVESLSQSRQADASLVLVPALCDNNWRVRGAAMDAMVRIGDNAIPALIEVYNESDWTVRSTVIEALGKIGGRNALLVLGQAVEDPDASVRRAVAESIGMIGGVDVKQSVMSELQSNEADVRRDACIALSEIRYPGVITALAPLLQDVDLSVRAAAADAYGKLRELEIIAAVYRLMTNDRYATVRRAATNAMNAVDDADPVPLLVEALLDREWQVRAGAGEALVILDGYAQAQLTELMPQASPSLRVAAKEVLDRIQARSSGNQSPFA